MAGFKFLHLPYKGAFQIVGDVMAGQAQLGIGSYTSLSPNVRTGKLRLIGVTNTASSCAASAWPTNCDGKQR